MGPNSLSALTIPFATGQLRPFTIALTAKAATVKMCKGSKGQKSGPGMHLTKHQMRLRIPY